MNTRHFSYRIMGLFLVLLASACGQKMDRKEYIEWVQDYSNGLHVKKNVNHYIFDVQYLPPAYRWFQVHRDKSSDTPMEMQFSKDGLQYYLLKIGFADGKTDLIKGVAKDKKIWEKRAYYFSYRFQQHLYLEEDGRKLPCELFHFEKAFDLRPERTFVLGFASGQGMKEINMVINSPAFDTGPVKIPISKMNIPKPEL